jgi:hypothetical protein
VADNLGIGIYTKKDNSNDGAAYPYDNQATEADPDKPAQKAFPVYIRFRNSVVYGNTPPSLSTTISGTASVWDWTGYPSLSVQLPPVGREGRETYEYSLLEGMDLSAAGTGNLDGTTVSPGFVSPLGSSRGTGGDYRPAAGSALIDPSPNGADLYPASGSDVLGQLFWKLDTNNGGLLNVFIQPLLYTAISNPVHLDLREYFLQYDNSFNTGDLRYDWVDDDLDKNGNWLTANLRDNWLEGPKSKTRPGLLDIGAYEQ